MYIYNIGQSFIFTKSITEQHQTVTNVLRVSFFMYCDLSLPVTNICENTMLINNVIHGRSGSDITIFSRTIIQSIINEVYHLLIQIVFEHHRGIRILGYKCDISVIVSRINYFSRMGIIPKVMNLIMYSSSVRKS